MVLWAHTFFKSFWWVGKQCTHLRITSHIFHWRHNVFRPLISGQIREVDGKVPWWSLFGLMYEEGIYTRYLEVTTQIHPPPHSLILFMKEELNWPDVLSEGTVKRSSRPNSIWDACVFHSDYKFIPTLNRRTRTWERRRSRTGRINGRIFSP